MAIKIEELIEKGKGIEDVEEELAGIKELKWDSLNFDENLKIVKNKLDTTFVHIQELLRTIEESRKKREEIEEMLAKRKEDFSSLPHYKLYEQLKVETDLLFNIVSILALQLDTVMSVNEKLKGLLFEAKKYGVLSQKVETELEILRSERDTLKIFMEEMRKHNFEVVDKFTSKITEIYTNLLKAIEEIRMGKVEVDLTPLQKRIDELEERIRELESRSEEEKQTIKVVEDVKGKSLYEKVKKLMFEEGITDRFEIAERLGVTPMQVSLAGYKELLNKLKEKEKQESEEESEEEIEEEENG